MRKKHFVIALLINVIIFLIPFLAFAWGQTGHRVIGQIAECHLSKKASKNLKKLMGHESLAMASTWMDDIKSDPRYNHTHDWHWVSIPDGKTYEESVKNPNGDVIMTLERIVYELKNNVLSDSIKREHVRMLVHLVGDIHQPLHVGNGLDKGGNDVKVKWFGQNSNLHKVWDTDMINGYQLSYTEYARAINHAERDQIKRWQTASVRDWAYESMAVREAIYAVDNPDRMGYKYAYTHRELMEERMLQAGIRLAGIFNQIFG